MKKGEKVTLLIEDTISECGNCTVRATPYAKFKDAKKEFDRLVEQDRRISDEINIREFSDTCYEYYEEGFYNELHVCYRLVESVVL